jgi:hypothetical protein
MIGNVFWVITTFGASIIVACLTVSVVVVTAVGIYKMMLELKGPKSNDNEKE